MRLGEDDHTLGQITDAWIATEIGKPVQKPRPFELVPGFAASALRPAERFQIRPDPFPQGPGHGVDEITRRQRNIPLRAGQPARVTGQFGSLQRRLKHVHLRVLPPLVARPRTGVGHPVMFPKRAGRRLGQRFDEVPERRNSVRRDQAGRSFRNGDERKQHEALIIAPTSATLGTRHGRCAIAAIAVAQMRLEKLPGMDRAVAEPRVASLQVQMRKRERAARLRETRTRFVHLWAPAHIKALGHATAIRVGNAGKPTRHELRGEGGSHEAQIAAPRMSK
ncbi:hypothetical protein OCH239_07035 [Roseivivax halodurans JCM 10272]|uniref:Uncharacterized protein n=1 Tax=Roseivivax halodurans JCM 10272 TaxID=1449350 RepID=X7ECT6_9RHOB|nr:hypothetical protein OCH239_07035 [Roseivivax halodurans JCM 10272]